MHEEQPQSEHEPAAPQPRIYVASLADYNDGRLHGAWLDAARPADDLRDDIDGLLARSPTPGAEEWAIHDYDGFGRLEIHEFTDLATVSRLAHGIEQYGEAFAALADWLGPAEATADRFERHYRGTWESILAYVDDLLSDLGAEQYLQDVPDWLRPYVRIDRDGLVRDLQLGGDIYVSDVEGGVAVFDAHA